jgi:hypothetical protein
MVPAALAAMNPAGRVPACDSPSPNQPPPPRPPAPAAQTHAHLLLCERRGQPRHAYARRVGLLHNLRDGRQHPELNVGRRLRRALRRAERGLVVVGPPDAQRLALARFGCASVGGWVGRCVETW